VEGYKTLGCWEVKDKSGDEDERDSKRCKVSAGPGVDDDSCFSLGKSTATEVNVEIPENLDTGWGAAVEESNDSANGDWGAGGTGWGDDDGMGWGGGVTTVDCSAWEPPTRDTLLTFLGPTVLPLTHETGVVEMSVRRIKEVRPVGQGEGGGRKGGGTGPDPEGVEAELGSRFAKVVLEPWVGWNSGEEVNMSKPRILETSRGAVVGVDKATVESGGKEATKPHDPSNDDIVLLADPGVLGTLSVGMGLGATWIQVVRQDQVQEGGKKGRKGKGKERKTVEKYWYLEELTMILPSYYM
jgi:hypothetical protein